MLFNSFEFLLFLPIVFILYWFVFNKKLSWQNGLVLVASYFFYGWWSWKFMGLLMISTLLDYLYGFWVDSPNRKKAKFFLYLSILNNLGILGIFKYYNFFALQFQKGFDLLGLHTHPVLLNVALPIGISFYTFHGMSYVFDIYRGHQKPVKSFIDYAVFVSFFPLLVAGPIERASHLLPQVQKERKFNYTQAVEGCRLILLGMFKKVVLADQISYVVDSVYVNFEIYSSSTLLFAAISFSIQIYCDFSGYSDIALGIAKLFGFELLVNFRNPYFSVNITDFWKRWHISLSSWFKDYLYIPLGGRRVGIYRKIRNIIIIFIVSGFWHGANINFLIWGLLHGMLYVLSEYINLRFLPKIFKIFFMFLLITFTWIFFRIHDYNIAIKIIKNIFTFKNILELQYKKYLYLILVFFVTEVVYLKLVNWHKYLRISFYYILLYFVFKNSIISGNTFIYFQF